MTKQFYKSSLSRKCRYGMTLVELLLALGATGLITAAVASMLAAVSYGSSSTQDMRSLVADSKRIHARMSALLRSSTQLLESSDSHFVVWVNDVNESGTPNLHEIRTVIFDVDADKIKVLKPVENANSTEFAMDSDFLAASNAAVSSGDMNEHSWNNSFDTVEFSHEHNEAQTLRVLSVTIELMNLTMRESVVVSSRFRNEP
ncbi:hypothetical protein JD969_16295 [Planctomycetota bacterium]|nr:hypothetical protein JD969_16295 [Planctomycetota bacterium]